VLNSALAAWFNCFFTVLEILLRILYERVVAEHKLLRLRSFGLLIRYFAYFCAVLDSVITHS
jgi:hypothetical protein